jgi:hypothetical protein
MFPFHVVVQLEGASGFTDETVVNTFNFVTATVPDETDYANLASDVQGFYNAYQGGGSLQISDYIAGHISRAAEACSLKIYDLFAALDGDPHGSPVYSQNWTLGAAAVADALPAQVASVITLRGRGALLQPVEAGGTPPLTRPRSRYTGRIYLGPLNGSAVTTSSSGIARSSEGWRNVAGNACEELQEAANADGWIWAVWSRSDAAMRGITSVEIDNSLDVMRSRKQPATERVATVFSPVPSLSLGA